MYMNYFVVRSKKISMIYILLLALTITPANVNAASTIQACDVPGASKSAVCQDKNSYNPDSNPVIGIIKTAINIVSYMAGAAAIIGILLSSIRFMTANGDENSISSAKKTLIYSAIGVIVVLIAQSIVAFALNKY